MKTGILSGFLELDEKLRKIPEVANGEDKSGTTAVCVLITEKYVLFSNCGDSRGVLSGKTGSGNDASASRYDPSHSKSAYLLYYCIMMIFIFIIQ